jgi:hypothetical protein
MLDTVFSASLLRALAEDGTPRGTALSHRRLESACKSLPRVFTSVPIVVTLYTILALVCSSWQGAVQCSHASRRVTPELFEPLHRLGGSG